MTKHMTLAKLSAAGLVLPLSNPTKAQICFALEQEYLAHSGTKYNLGQPFYVQIGRIEDTELKKLLPLSSAGTAFDPAVQMLNSVGIKTEPTFGGFMGTLGLTKDDMHELICFCDGIVQDAKMMASRFHTLGEKFANAEA